MGQTLILIGVGCIIAAIVGGGIKLQQLEVGAVTSLWRQGLLGVFGVLVSAFGFGVSQDYFKAAPVGESSARGPASNTADPPGKADPAANMPAPVGVNPKQDPAEHKAKPPAAKPETNEQAALTMHDQNGLPVVDVSGTWIDASGRKLRFTQEGAKVRFDGGDGASPGPWTGAGNLYRKSRIQLDVTAAPGAAEFCKGPTYKALMVLTCEDPISGANVRQMTLRKIG